MTHPKKYTREDYAALSHLSRADAARALGVSHAAVRAMAMRHGLEFAPSGVNKFADYAALTHLCVEDAAARLGVKVENLKRYARKNDLRFSDQAPTKLPAKARSVVARPRRVSAAPLAGSATAEVAGMAPAMCAAPAWSDLRDGRILETRGRYRAVAKLAASWGLPISRVMARWHVLRAAR